MLAGVLRGAGRIELESVPDPVAGPADLVLEVRACGVCGSDLPSFRAPGPNTIGTVMGHEFAGVARQVGTQVSGISVGDRLTGLPIQPCGSCAHCRGGLSHLCQVWTTRSIAFGLPGAFAQLLRIPTARLGHNVHRLPDGIDFAGGALIEPTSVAVHAVGLAPPVAGRVAVVLGLGPIGLQAGQVLLAKGAALVVGVDVAARRRAVAAQLGMAVVDGADPAALARRLAGRPVDVVVEASGVSALVNTAAGLLGPRGTCVLVALYHRPAALDAMALVQREITVRGSANVTPADFREAIALLGAGRVRTEPLVSHRFGLREVNTALHTQLDPHASVKVLVTPEPAGAVSPA